MNLKSMMNHAIVPFQQLKVIKAVNFQLSYYLRHNYFLARKMCIFTYKCVLYCISITQPSKDPS